MKSQGNGRKYAQNDKTIVNTIYMKPDFPIIKKSVKIVMQMHLNNIYKTNKSKGKFLRVFLH